MLPFIDFTDNHFQYLTININCLCCNLNLVRDLNILSKPLILG